MRVLLRRLGWCKGEVRLTTKLRKASLPEKYGPGLKKYGGEYSQIRVGWHVNWGRCVISAFLCDAAVSLEISYSPPRHRERRDSAEKSGFASKLRECERCNLSRKECSDFEAKQSKAANSDTTGTAG
jgi:predicted secreted Zn-dependent protease